MSKAKRDLQKVVHTLRSRSVGKATRLLLTLVETHHSQSPMSNGDLEEAPRTLWPVPVKDALLIL
jgi:hypothetical protein